MKTELKTICLLFMLCAVPALAVETGTQTPALRETFESGFSNWAIDVDPTGALTIENGEASVKNSVITTKQEFTPTKIEFDLGKVENYGTPVFYVYLAYIDDNNAIYLEKYINDWKWRLKKAVNGAVTTLATSEEHPLGNEMQHFTITNEDGRITVTIDGIILLQVIDNAFQKGKFRLSSWAAGPYGTWGHFHADNIRIYEKPQDCTYAFMENFDADLSNWITWVDPTGALTIENGEASVKNSVITTKQEFTPTKIEFDLGKVENYGVPVFYIFIAYKGNNPSYEAKNDGLYLEKYIYDEKWRLKKAVNGAVTTLATSEEHPLGNEMQHFTITNEDGRITVIVNEAVLVQAYDSTFQTGKLKLSSWASGPSGTWGHFHVDNIRVCEKQADQPQLPANPQEPIESQKLADLVPVSVSFSNSEPQIGETIDITVRVENHGDADAKNVVVRLYDITTQFSDGFPALESATLTDMKQIDLIPAQQSAKVIFRSKISAAQPYETSQGQQESFTAGSIVKEFGILVNTVFSSGKFGDTTWVSDSPIPLSSSVPESDYSNNLLRAKVFLKTVGAYDFSKEFYQTHKIVGSTKLFLDYKQGIKKWDPASNIFTVNPNTALLQVRLSSLKVDEQTGEIQKDMGSSFFLTSSDGKTYNPTAINPTGTEYYLEIKDPIPGTWTFQPTNAQNKIPTSAEAVIRLYSAILPSEKNFKATIPIDEVYVIHPSTTSISYETVFWSGQIEIWTPDELDNKQKEKNTVTVVVKSYGSGNEYYSPEYYEIGKSQVDLWATSGIHIYNPTCVNDGRTECGGAGANLEIFPTSLHKELANFIIEFLGGPGAKLVAEKIEDFLDHTFELPTQGTTGTKAFAAIGFGKMQNYKIQLDGLELKPQKMLLTVTLKPLGEWYSLFVGRYDLATDKPTKQNTIIIPLAEDVEVAEKATIQTEEAVKLPPLKTPQPWPAMIDFYKPNLVDFFRTKPVRIMLNYLMGLTYF